MFWGVAGSRATEDQKQTQLARKLAAQEPDSNGHRIVKVQSATAINVEANRLHVVESSCRNRISLKLPTRHLLHLAIAICPRGTLS